MSPVASKNLAMALIAIVCAALNADRAHAQAEDRFVRVTEGLLDTQTGLVWGHSLVEVEHVLAGGSSGGTYGWERAMDMALKVDYELDGVVDDEITYQEFSNTMYERNDTDWRIPTRDELIDAIDAGLMLELDVSPVAGLQLFDPEVRPDDVWSSTEGGKKRGGFDSAYYVNLVTGESDRLTIGSLIGGAIPVRGAPAPSNDGGGKGNGKGKKK